MYYVYEDWTRENQPRCFYVGKGQDNRVKDFRRNRKHTNYVKKFGVERKIVFTTLDEQEAFKRESDLINERNTLGINGGFGCNFTYGGEGVSAPSKRKGTTLPEDHRRNISLGKKGKPTHWSRPKSDMFKEHMKRVHTGKRLSNETRAKISAAGIGKKNRAKPVHQFSVNGKFLQRHDSIMDAKLTLKITSTSQKISKCCNLQCDAAFGFSWRWA